MVEWLTARYMIHCVRSKCAHSPQSHMIYDVNSLDAALRLRNNCIMRGVLLGFRLLKEGSSYSCVEPSQRFLFALKR